MKAILTDAVQFVLATLDNGRCETRLVGGAVRDFLMDEPICDVDMATTATPQKIMEICSSAGMRTIPISVEHGTVMVICGENKYEVTTLRRDVQTFGRRATVAFSDSFKEDSQRRDFSINAIYLDKAGKLYDYHNGLADLEQRNIRFIGDPAQRIQEDYLRILRYFRFLARYGKYKVDEKYLHIIASLVPGMSQLSTTRITEELLKIFEIRDSYKIIPHMKNVLEQLFQLHQDPLAVCHELEIFYEMSPTDKFCMLLLFSRSNIRNLIERYHFHRGISRQTLLFSNNEPFKIDGANFTRNLLDSIQKRLKKITRRQWQNFYIQYSIVDLYLRRVITDASTAKLLIFELQNFSNSGYADFKFRPHLLADLKLTPQQLGIIMTATRTFWLESSVAVSEVDCLAFAKNYALRVAQMKKC
ncbi:MAG: CCA tRNA nucleotidyltransferase [Holosporaceae bacterium]|nr:CCA tRNA nucleotidyltransferase [Holosporaceae bacterium]